ncbi:hypothetical protein T484DRAFT_1843635 [Baffinella frigidus]|nr:hypothetical protein T484DRAFT_1843635 [Cryptophyta sp. CCMP2293]
METVDGKLELRDALHFSPLHFAACYGHAEATSLILRSGVDPDPATALILRLRKWGS